MKDIFLGFLPDKMVLIFTLIAWLAPFTVYKINKKLHEKGDPPWNKEENGEGSQLP
jgi:hypothetical protein